MKDSTWSIVWKVIGGVLLFVLLDIVLFCGLFTQILLPPIFLLCFGWIFYLLRVVPDVHPDVGTVALGVIACLVLVIGSHRMFGWFGEKKQTMTPLDSKIVENFPAREIATPCVWQWKWTLMINLLVLLMFVAGICIVGIFHQIAWMAQAPNLVNNSMQNYSNQAHSSNNLRQLGLGAHAHESVYGTFPAGTVTDAQGNALHGWMTSLLPYMDMGMIYDKIDMKKPWTDPVNRDLFQTRVRSFENSYLQEDPGIGPDKKGYALSHYSGNTFLLGNQQGFALAAIGDGASNTILTGEAATNLKPWGHPFQKRDPTLGLDNHPDGFGSHRRDSIVQFGMADGSVRTIRKNVDPKVLKALSTPNGQEFVDPDSHD